MTASGKARFRPNGSVPFDFQRMVNNFGDEELTKQILVTYAEQLRSRLAELREAIQTDRYRDIHRIAHSIRGGAQNIYDQRLSDAARHIEEAAKHTEKGIPGAALYSVLEREVTILAEAVKIYRGRGPHGKGSIRRR